MYAKDPHWITLRYPEKIDGVIYRKGTRAFYYPLTNKILIGDKAEQAARDFAAACFDEGSMFS